MNKDLEKIKKEAEKEIKNIKAGGSTYDNPDASNEIFFQLERKFGYNWENDPKAFNYFSHATDEEILKYAVEIIIPKLEKENKKENKEKQTEFNNPELFLKKYKNFLESNSFIINGIKYKIINVISYIEDDDINVGIKTNKNIPEIDGDTFYLYGRKNLKEFIKGDTIQEDNMKIKLYSIEFKKENKKSWVKAEQKYKEIIKSKKLKK